MGTRNLILIVCAMVLAIAGCTATSSQAPQALDQIRQLSKPAKPWGIYQILWRTPQFTQELDRNLNLLGGNPEYVLFFRDLHKGREFPSSIVRVADERGLTPIISLELSTWGREGPGYLQGIIKGDYDHFFSQWGTDAAAWGKPILLRFGFEMNGDWFHWGQQPEAFIAAWKRAHALMKDAGADNVQWVFNPNVLYGGMNADEGIHAYYPGDEVVDVVALDGYNFGDNHGKWHSWQSYHEVFEASIEAMSRYQKPLILTEVGCADDPRKAGWLADCLTRIQDDQRVDGVVFFHFDKRRENEHNWRLDSDPQSLDVFRAWAQLPEH